MPKFDVDFYIRHYNGSITVDAENERDAHLIVERLNADKLEKHTSSVEVYVELVTPSPTVSPYFSEEE